MSDNVFLNRDKTKVVPPGSAEAKWQVTRREAFKLGLLDTPDKPVQERRGPQKRRTTKKTE